MYFVFTVALLQSINDIRLLGIGLELARICKGGSCGGISLLKRDKVEVRYEMEHLQFSVGKSLVPE